MKQILITGASTGIGYCLARNLLEQGHQVFAGVRKVATLDRLKEDFPDRLTVLKLDVTIEGDIQAAFNEINKKFDKDKEFVLVNNAGIAVAGPIEALPLDEWRKLYDVNLFAAVRMSQVFLPLVRQTRGRVLNVGSISGLISSPFLSPYCSSKFALRSFSDSLRRELLPLGVKVILIEPGPVRTEIWSKSISHSEEQSRKMSDEMKSIYGSRIDSLRSSVKETVKEAIPVEIVARAMVKAVVGDHPRLNYLLGRRIRLHAALGKYLPARLVDRMMMSGLQVEKS